ncbi:hypothetical protein [Allomesorhizobium alhagi]|uniref:hypothetical protein n=1 Tax=Allomesorhizobium alhagi TaxID=475067 RepID=UPI001AEC46F0|nr:hypothetical protein [Mesorhizobium alhagi]
MMINLFVISHEHRDRLDIVLLALAVQARRTGGLECGGYVLQLGRQIGRPGERIVENDHCAAPMGHAACGIGLCDRAEGFGRRRPPEGMVKRHGAIELRLRRGIALDLELYFSEALGSDRVAMRALRASEPPSQGPSGHRGDPGRRPLRQPERPDQRPQLRGGAKPRYASAQGGGQSLVEGSLEEGQYACHPFTISKPEQPKDQCSEGFVMNDAGRCVCPKGTTFRNGRCTADQGATPTPTPKPRWPPPRQCRTAARPDPDAGRPVRVPARHQAAERALPPGRGRMPEGDKAGARSMRDHAA